MTAWHLLRGLQSNSVPVYVAWMPSQPACHTSCPRDAVHSRVSPLPPLSARHRTVAARALSASSSPDWSRRAAALGVSPRVAAPRRCRYSNPRKPTAANLAELSVHGGFPKVEAGGVAAYPLSDAMAAPLGLPATIPSKAHRDGQRHGQQQGVQSHATALFRPPQGASAADRECYASAEVQHGLESGN